MSTHIDDTSKAQSYQQSAFAVIAAGGDPSNRPEQNSRRTQSKKLFDSAEYFYEQTIMMEKAQRLKAEQERMEQQSRESFELACATMSEKYGTSSDQIKKLSQMHKEKKKFDSADYFMKNSGIIEEPIQEQEENQADRAMRQQANIGEKNYICCAKRNPLVSKQRKNFDSADFFMQEHDKNHPITQLEWEEMLEQLIKQTELEYNQSAHLQTEAQQIQQDDNQKANSALPEEPNSSQTSAEPSKDQIESQTDRIVQLQSEKMEPLYILRKKKNPLINRGRSYYQFDSADYFMQQADSQNNQQQGAQQQQQVAENISIDESIKSQADICERHYILKKKSIILKVSDSLKKRKEFDSADYFMEKAAANSSSDNSISED